MRLLRSCLVADTGIENGESDTFSLRMYVKPRYLWSLNIQKLMHHLFKSLPFVLGRKKGLNMLHLISHVHVRKRPHVVAWSHWLRACAQATSQPGKYEKWRRIKILAERKARSISALVRYWYKRGGYNSVEPSEAERNISYNIVIAKDKGTKTL